MEARKAKGSIDELSLVKATTWAWYPPQFDLSTTHEKTTRPSRNKLESIKELPESSEENEKSLLVSPLLMSPLSSDRTDISLLDAYEIQRISTQLELYIESSKAHYHRSVFGGSDKRGRGKVADFPLENGRMVEKKLKEKNEKLKGFWLVACRSRHDAIEGRRSNVAAASRCPEKAGVVVAAAGSRPGR